MVGGDRDNFGDEFRLNDGGRRGRDRLFDVTGLPGVGVTVARVLVAASGILCTIILLRPSIGRGFSLVVVVSPLLRCIGRRTVEWARWMEGTRGLIVSVICGNDVVVLPDSAHNHCESIGGHGDVVVDDGVAIDRGAPSIKEFALLKFITFAKVFIVSFGWWSRVTVGFPGFETAFVVGDASGEDVDGKVGVNHSVDDEREREKCVGV